jgi:hypothetical protein
MSCTWIKAKAIQRPAAAPPAPENSADARLAQIAPAKMYHFRMDARRLLGRAYWSGMGRFGFSVTVSPCNVLHPGSSFACNPKCNRQRPGDIAAWTQCMRMPAPR